MVQQPVKPEIAHDLGEWLEVHRFDDVVACEIFISTCPGISHLIIQDRPLGAALNPNTS
jgi:hypothetical protein